MSRVSMTSKSTLLLLIMFNCTNTQISHSIIYDNTTRQVEHCINKSKVIMMPGMVFTIEPILVEGNRRISVWEDGWTAATLDGGRYVKSLCLC